MTVAKDLTFRERLGATFMFQFSNLPNHVRFADPTLSLANPSTFGVITRSAAGSTTIPLYTPRQLEFGVEIPFLTPEDPRCDHEMERDCLFRAPLLPLGFMPIADLCCQSFQRLEDWFWLAHERKKCCSGQDHRQERRAAHVYCLPSALQTS